MEHLAHAPAPWTDSCLHPRIAKENGASDVRAKLTSMLKQTYSGANENAWGELNSWGLFETTVQAN
jgi:hypothetical protein